MALREQMEKQGEYLFRWRSYLPVLILPFLILSLPHSGYGQKLLGKGFDLFIEVFSVVISLSGVGLRCLTIGYVPSGTSGRNNKQQKAAVLNVSGPYAIVRHPLYLGNFLIFLGILFFLQVWWFALIGLLSFWLYYERIMLREEEFLRDKFERAYLDWANETPAFLPRLSGWMSPQERFSWKTILRKEYTGFFLVTTVFAVLENVQDVMVLGEKELDQVFIGLFGIGSVVYVALRTIKKRTSLLQTKLPDTTQNPVLKGVVLPPINRPGFYVRIRKEKEAIGHGQEHPLTGTAHSKTEGSGSTLK
jgi:protein-S-isoprenylcysteine O-methyltransferase Ste14